MFSILWTTERRKKTNKTLARTKLKSRKIFFRHPRERNKSVGILFVLIQNKERSCLKVLRAKMPRTNAKYVGDAMFMPLSLFRNDFRARREDALWCTLWKKAHWHGCRAVAFSASVHSFVTAVAPSNWESEQKRSARKKRDRDRALVITRRSNPRCKYNLLRDRTIVHSTPRDSPLFPFFTPTISCSSLPSSLVRSL